MKIEYIDPKDLKPTLNQPITHMAELHIQMFVREYGGKFGEKLIEPIEVDANNMIVRGHKRREAALRVGLDKVPIKRVEDGDTDKQQRWMNSLEVEGNSTGYVAWAYMTAVINDNQEKQYTMSEVEKMSKDMRNKLFNCKAKKKMTEHNLQDKQQNSQEK